MSTTIPDAASELELPIIGFSVNCCSIDFAFTLHLVRGEEDAYVHIETPFECILPTARFQCDPVGNPEEFGPALNVLHRSIKAALAARDGSLHITFDGMIALHVSGHPKYEAWSYNGPDGLLLVSLPGGDISAFPG